MRGEGSLRGPLLVIATAAVLVLLYVSASLVAPIVAAVLISFLFKPTVRRIEHRGIPAAIPAIMIVLFLFVVAAGPILGIIGYAGQLIDNAPEYMEELEARFVSLNEAVQADSGTEDGDNPDSPAVTGDGDMPGIDTSHDWATQQVTPVDEAARADQVISWVSTRTLGPLMTQTRDTIVMTVFILLLVFFLLAAGDTFLRRSLGLLPTFHGKRNMVETIYEIEKNISGYLITLTSINVVFGIAAGVIFWALGAPSPLLWGVAAGLCNFVPYVGPIAFWLVFTPVCLLHFPNPLDALWPSLAFIALNILEAYIIGPHIYGKRMALHPLAVFLGVAVLGWMWGVLGAFMAVPIVVCINTISRHFDTFKPISVLLSGEDEPLRVHTQPDIGPLAGEAAASGG